ncbi:nuclear transport factor 2 family protein [Mesorhizobium sp. B2-3-11]|uniref:YybH family protein n=1 Tax=Mesorhizobium sp. B2-3-11 TaxID=2589953 RepID=UPI00112DAFE2|nr:nuclear transport factor 2 family protein [Mesorhizobium sp. B2-3-11]TPM02814.1 nuclear transport factor 2 family protein [Mesorhizobium sp. B2-3-11]
MLASDLAKFIEQDHLALGAFVKGDPEPLKNLYSRRDDVIIANPFGPPAKGWIKAAETMDRAATNYRDGEVIGFERIAEYATADLGYIIEIERLQSKVGGADKLVPIALRVTTIFRQEDGAWKIVLRHADPITSARPAATIVGQ